MKSKDFNHINSLVNAQHHPHTIAKNLSPPYSSHFYGYVPILFGNCIVTHIQTFTNIIMYMYFVYIYNIYIYKYIHIHTRTSITPACVIPNRFFVMCSIWEFGALLLLLLLLLMRKKGQHKRNQSLAILPFGSFCFSFLSLSLSLIARVR